VAFREPAVGFGVDPAHEEGRDRPDRADAAPPDSLLQPFEQASITLDAGRAQDQRDVGVEAAMASVIAGVLGSPTDHDVGPSSR
jgi:hypothetical protein